LFFLPRHRLCGLARLDRPEVLIHARGSVGEIPMSHDVVPPVDYSRSCDLRWPSPLCGAYRRVPCCAARTGVDHEKSIGKRPLVRKLIPTPCRTNRAAGPVVGVKHPRAVWKLEVPDLLGYYEPLAHLTIDRQRAGFRIFCFRGVQANLIGIEIDLWPLDRGQFAAPPANVVTRLALKPAQTAPELRRPTTRRRCPPRTALQSHS